MYCLECSNKMKKTKVDTYHYIECGLSNVYLLKINVWVCESCGGEEAEIPSIESLHQEIMRLLVTKKTQFNPVEFRFLRTYLGLSSKDFSSKVGVSAETVSRWENKKAKIPFYIDVLLRHMALLNKKNHDYSVENLAEILEYRQIVRKILVGNKSNGWKAKAA